MLDSKLNTELFLLQFEEFISLNDENDENVVNSENIVNSDTKFKLGDILYTADEPHQFCILDEINGKLVLKYADEPYDLPFVIMSKIVNNNIKYNKVLSKLGYLGELFFGNDGSDDVVRSYKDKNIF